MPPDFAAHLPRRWTTPDRWWAALLALLAFALYVRTGRYGFIYYDDQAYVAANPYVRQGLTWPGVRWACTATVVDNWHPVTLLAELALSTVFGPSAGTFHLANAALFAGNAGLLFGFLRTATGRTGPAAAAAALWAVHPLRVESVAWIAELKDELSGLFWLAGLLAYAAYGRRRTAGRYAAVAALLALAVLSKPTAIPLPAVLLLADRWPLGRGGRDGRWWSWRLAEKVPLAALAAAAAVVRLRTQSVPHNLLAMPWTVRAANAVVSVVTYLRQAVWPTGLGLFYPHPWLLRQPIPAGPVVAGAALLITISAGVLVAAASRPYLLFGWAWFWVTLLPVLGLLQAGDQARADRYTYLPSMGLTIAVVWWVGDWARGAAARRAVATAAAAAAAVALAGVTLALVPAWRSCQSVWTRADDVIPRNYVAKAFLSALALRDGDLPTAERFAREAVAIVPRGVSDGHRALAEVLDAEHRPAEAGAEFDAALRVAPADGILRYKAGLFLDGQGRGGPARAQFAKAVELDPAWVAPRLAAGRSLLAGGRCAEAAEAFRRALAIDPGNGSAEGGLADALRAGGDPAAARPHYAAALAADEHDPAWEAELARMLAEDATSTAADLSRADALSRHACEQTSDRQPLPLYARSLALARLGRSDQATAAARRALSLARSTGQATLAADIDARLAADAHPRPAPTRPVPPAAATRPRRPL